MAAPYEVQLRLADGEHVVVEDFTELTYTRTVNDVGTIQITAPADAAWVTPPLETARVRVLLGGREDFYGPLRGIGFSGSGKSAPAVSVRGTDFIGEFADRSVLPLDADPLAKPSTAGTKTVYTGVYADAMLKTVASRSLAYGWGVLGLSAGTALNQGNVIDYAIGADTPDALAAMQEIATTGGIDFGIVRVEGDGPLEERPLEVRTGWPLWGVDRSYGNPAGRDPVLLSVELAALDSWTYDLDWARMQNVVLVTSEDDLGARKARLFEDTANRLRFGARPALLPIGSSELPGRDMENRGKAHLEEHGKPVETLDLTLSDTGQYRYGEHFFLGDAVTLRLPELGRMGRRQLKAQVTQATVTVRPGAAEPEVRIELGKRLTRDRMRRLSRRIKRVEQGL